MERKIGEIFNYQDNWYQCIENTGYGCIICHFNTHNNICCNNVLNIIGNLLWGLFLVVLSPASLIVIIIVELVDSGFFKKSL